MKLCESALKRNWNHFKFAALLKLWKQQQNKQKQNYFHSLRTFQRTKVFKGQRQTSGWAAFRRRPLQSHSRSDVVSSMCLICTPSYFLPPYSLDCIRMIVPLLNFLYSAQASAEKKKAQGRQKRRHFRSLQSQRGELTTLFLKLFFSSGGKKCQFRKGPLTCLIANSNSFSIYPWQCSRWGHWRCFYITLLSVIAIQPLFQVQWSCFG